MVRIKHRYLLVHILSPSLPPSSITPSPSILHFHPPTPPSLTPPLLLRAIRDQILSLYGDHGAGLTAAGLSIKYLSPATSTFILRCPRAQYRLVWAALTYMTCLPAGDGRAGERGRGGRDGGQRACVMRVVRVSGTVRKAGEEAVRRARGDVLRARREEGEGFGVFLGEEREIVDGGEADEELGEEEDDEEEEEERG